MTTTNYCLALHLAHAAVNALFIIWFDLREEAMP